MKFLRLLNSVILYPIAERYLKRDIRSKVDVLREEHRAPASVRNQKQRERLYETLRVAGTHVPYYRDLFRDLNFNPESVLKDITALKQLPLLTKDILRQQGQRMIDERYLQKPRHVRTTNGSTGLVTTIWYDQESLDWTAAVNLFVSEWAGRSRFRTEVHLSTAFRHALPKKAAMIEQIKCWSLNRVNIYTSTFDDSGLGKIWTDLQRARTYSVQGHPSTLYFLALWTKSKGLKSKGIFRVFEATGETLDKSKAKIIAETFGCQVCNRYGSAEFGVSAHSLEDINELEVLDGIVYAESVSEAGQNHLILTGLRNPVMPLIRYHTGDIGEVIERENLQVLRGLGGRIHDVFEVGGKQYPTHFVKDILERMGGIDEFQIVMRDHSHFTLKIVPNEHFNESFVRKEVETYFGSHFDIEVSSFNGLILLGARDKFRYLIKTDS